MAQMAIKNLLADELPVGSRWAGTAAPYDSGRVCVWNEVRHGRDTNRANNSAFKHSAVTWP